MDEETKASDPREGDGHAQYTTASLISNQEEGAKGNDKCIGEGPVVRHDTWAHTSRAGSGLDPILDSPQRDGANDNLIRGLVARILACSRDAWCFMTSRYRRTRVDRDTQHIVVTGGMPAGPIDDEEYDTGEGLVDQDESEVPATNPDGLTLVNIDGAESDSECEEDVEEMSHVVPRRATVGATRDAQWFEANFGTLMGDSELLNGSRNGTFKIGMINTGGKVAPHDLAWPAGSWQADTLTF